MLVSLDWLKEHIFDHDLVILDTRPKTLYLYGHLENSHSLSIEQVIQFDQYGSNLVLDEKKISELFSSFGIDDSKTVVIIGDSLDPSAARIAWTLLYYGHENTFLLNSTISDLQNNGFQLTKKPAFPSSANFIAKINPEIRIDAEHLKENLTSLTILDARTPQEFMGGHLPNAKLVPFTDGIGYGGKLFQDSKSLHELFSQHQISKNEKIICYCMHGHRASSLFFQLRIAGFSNVKLYDGSFVEWYGRRFPLE